jgi:hypothetical protein
MGVATLYFDTSLTQHRLTFKLLRRLQTTFVTGCD